MLLIAFLEYGDADDPSALVEGADAVLLYGKTRPPLKTLPKMLEPLNEIPWGVYPADDDTETAELARAGCDFMLLTASGQIAAAPQDEKVGKILLAESSLDDGLIRAINDLPVDAALVADTLADGGPVLWHHLMIFQHIANLLSVPLIAQVPADITDEDLKAIYEADVEGILVEVDTAKAGALKELRQAIDKLPPRSARKRDKLEAMLPRTAEESRPAPPEEEEEEEEYE
jgi:hypothetical protein